MAPRSRSRPRRTQAFSSSRGDWPGMGRASKPRWPSWARVAAQRETLARLAPSCRAISAWESRPCRNSRAATRRRSSICFGVRCAGRHTLPSIAHLLTMTDTALCYTTFVKFIRLEADRLDEIRKAAEPFIYGIDKPGAATEAAAILEPIASILPHLVGTANQYVA